MSREELRMVYEEMKAKHEEKERLPRFGSTEWYENLKEEERSLQTE